MQIPSESIRIDKWLWAARFYKTRQLAVKAIKNGQVYSSSARLKPASNVHVGDLLIIKLGVFQRKIIVKALSENRGPARVAQELYQETQESIDSAKELKKTLAGQPKIQIDKRKPDKRGIRSSLKFKRGE
jgi:ribosome-associated heat shock protein Hsp15